LLYALISDVRTRIVENYPWQIMGIVGFLFLFYEHTTLLTTKEVMLCILPIVMFADAVIDRDESKIEIIVTTASYAISAFLFLYAVFFLRIYTGEARIVIALTLSLALVYFLYLIHAIHGGADAKAFMSIAVLHPMPYAFMVAGLPILRCDIAIFPPILSIIVYSGVPIVFIPIYYLVYNVYHRNIRFPHMLLGVPRDTKNMRFWLPMLVVDEKGNLREKLLPKRSVDYEKVIDELRRRGISRVWAMYKTPFMVMILPAYIFYALVGDIMCILSAIFG
ncbi:MAG: hypothetical protein DRN20_05620, partial [Thermoplasmata archaeon]